MRLELEGRLAGPWVSEFDRTWRSLALFLGSKKLVVDLRGVIHMDFEARQLLAEMHRRTGANFQADTPMIKYFVEEAQRRSEEEFKED
jgi:hypothetical protein